MQPPNLASYSWESLSIRRVALSLAACCVSIMTGKWFSVVEDALQFHRSSAIPLTVGSSAIPPSAWTGRKPPVGHRSRHVVLRYHWKSTNAHLSLSPLSLSLSLSLSLTLSFSFSLSLSVIFGLPWWIVNFERSSPSVYVTDSIATCQLCLCLFLYSHVVSFRKQLYPASMEQAGRKPRGYVGCLVVYELADDHTEVRDVTGLYHYEDHRSVLVCGVFTSVDFCLRGRGEGLARWVCFAPLRPRIPNLVGSLGPTSPPPPHQEVLLL